MEKIKEFLKTVNIIDTETTGIDFESSEIIEIASSRFIDDKLISKNLLIKPKNKIPPEASAIHFISNKMVENSLYFETALDSINNFLDIKNTNVMVAHNADFDRQMLKTEYLRASKLNELKPFDNQQKWICTWRLAKAVLGIDYARIQHGLSFLRYYLELDVDDDLIAHRAKTDTIICGKLLIKLIEIALKRELIDISKNIKTQLINLCWNPITITTWTIGKKYSGYKLEDIPNDYYMWALQNIDQLNEKNANYNLDLANSIEKILIDRGIIEE